MYRNLHIFFVRHFTALRKKQKILKKDHTREPLFRYSSRSRHTLKLVTGNPISRGVNPSITIDAVVNTDRNITARLIQRYTGVHVRTSANLIPRKFNPFPSPFSLATSVVK